MPNAEGWPPIPEKPKFDLGFAKLLANIIFALIEASKEKSQEIFKDISK